jgi:hypothetical protein
MLEELVQTGALSDAARRLCEAYENGASEEDLASLAYTMAKNVSDSQEAIAQIQRIIFDTAATFAHQKCAE